MRDIIKYVVLSIGLFASGCAQEQPVAPEVQIISVPSSKPYRYIHYSPKDTPETIKEVRAHNNSHALVKQAEERINAQK